MLELVKAVFPICSFMPIEILSLLVPKKTAGFFIPAEVSIVFIRASCSAVLTS